MITHKIILYTHFVNCQDMLLYALQIHIIMWNGGYITMTFETIITQSLALFCNTYCAFAKNK